MKINPNLPRRWATLMFLGLAGVMLVLGLTVWRKSLAGMGFVAYWLGCLALTLIAMLLAVREMSYIRRQNRAEKTGLIEQAFGDVASEMKDTREKRQPHSGA